MVRNNSLPPFPSAAYGIRVRSSYRGSSRRSVHNSRFNVYSSPERGYHRRCPLPSPILPPRRRHPAQIVNRPISTSTRGAPKPPSPSIRRHQVLPSSLLALIPFLTSSLQPDTFHRHGDTAKICSHFIKSIFHCPKQPHPSSTHAPSTVPDQRLLRPSLLSAFRRN